jgi:hypothetical protein
MQYKETQRIHESKKKEKEFERLKLKLGQVCLGCYTRHEVVV